MIRPTAQTDKLASLPPRPPVGDASGSIALGPASYALRRTVGEDGRLRYGIEGHAERDIPLSPGLAGRRVAVLDNLRSVWVLDDGTNALLAVSGFSGGFPHVYLLGAAWGMWIDIEGRRQIDEDPARRIAAAKLHADVNVELMQIRVEFKVNALYREAFSTMTRQSFYLGDHVNALNLGFEMPSGRFMQAKVVVSETKNPRSWTIPVEGFPILWPVKPGESPPPPPAPRTAPETKARMTPPSPQPSRPAPSTPPPSAAKAKFGQPPPAPPPTANHNGTSSTPQPPRAKFGGPAKAPLPPPAPKAKFGSTAKTPPPSADPAVEALFGPRRPEEIARDSAPKGPVRWNELSNEEAARIIAAEPSEPSRWKLVEANLGALARPDRCYALAGRFPDLFAENTPSWPPARLKAVFGQMPCALLAGIMHHWSVNQVIATAEENPDKDRIMEWLRHRELERLLGLAPGGEPATQEAARRDLGVDRNADAAAVKKAWRTLLGFLNADHGRHEERAIHKRKDEIAKRLQVARNILLKEK